MQVVAEEAALHRQPAGHHGVGPGQVAGGGGAGADDQELAARTMSGLRVSGHRPCTSTARYLAQARRQGSAPADHAGRLSRLSPAPPRCPACRSSRARRGCRPSTSTAAARGQRSCWPAEPGAAVFRQKHLPHAAVRPNLAHAMPAPVLTTRRPCCSWRGWIRTWRRMRKRSGTTRPPRLFTCIPRLELGPRPGGKDGERLGNAGTGQWRPDPCGRGPERPLGVAPELDVNPGTPCGPGMESPMDLRVCSESPCP